MVKFYNMTQQKHCFDSRDLQYHLQAGVQESANMINKWGAM